MNRIHVVNKATYASSTPYQLYVGRGSVLGNPYTSKDLDKTKAKYQCVNKEEALSNYRKYLLEKIKEKDKDICAELNTIHTLAIKHKCDLVCYCAPKKCHADIIKEIVSSKLVDYYIKKGAFEPF